MLVEQFLLSYTCFSPLVLLTQEIIILAGRRSSSFDRFIPPSSEVRARILPAASPARPCSQTPGYQSFHPSPLGSRGSTPLPISLSGAKRKNTQAIADPLQSSLPPQPQEEAQQEHRIVQNRGDSSAETTSDPTSPAVDNVADGRRVKPCLQTTAQSLHSPSQQSNLRSEIPTGAASAGDEAVNRKVNILQPNVDAAVVPAALPAQVVVAPSKQPRNQLPDDSRSDTWRYVTLILTDQLQDLQVLYSVIGSQERFERERVSMLVAVLITFLLSPFRLV